MKPGNLSNLAIKAENRCQYRQQDKVLASKSKLNDEREDNRNFWVYSLELFRRVHFYAGG